jgi:hypothetical protein
MPTLVAPFPTDRPASLFSGRPVTQGERVFLSVFIAVMCAVAVLVILGRVPQFVAKDFTYPWRAARVLLAGQDPYVVIQPTGVYPFESRFPYPLPAALVSIPFAGLPAAIGAALFFGLSTGGLSWALLGLGRGISGLWVLAGAPFCMALAVVQWGPLLLLGALLPAFAWTLALKPTLGLALFVWRPTRGAVIGGLLLGALALLWVPRWPIEWVQAALHTTGHPAFVTQPFGWLPLLALFRWRDPDARLVAVLACIPQNPYFYDQLPLALVARSGWSAFSLAALSWVGYAGTEATCLDPHFCGAESIPWVIWFVYAPVTAMVLLRAHSVRALADRVLVRFHRAGSTARRTIEADGSAASEKVMSKNEERRGIA